MAKKPLEIDMIAGSQLRDTQGEMLSIEGADISELIAGKGRLNDNHGKGFFNAIGRITEAKKIFKAEDCEDDRQRHYWEKVKAPYIYVKGQLYDDEDHPNAKAAAAILRNIHKTDAPLQLKASVEGGVVSRGVKDSSFLARTKIHSVALTFTPANNATLVEPISLDKSTYNEAADLILIKSVMHLAETNVPSFRHIARDASATKVESNLIKLSEMMAKLGLDEKITVPSKQQILQKAIEEKIKNNVSKIHEIARSIREEDIEKGMKEAVAGALTAATLAGSSAKAPTEVRSQPKIFSERADKTPQASTKKISHEDVYKEVSNKNPLLGAIGCVESSCGKNMNHVAINKPGSPNHGHTAAGPWGMTPNSVATVIKRNKNLAEKYPDIAEAVKNIKTDHKKITDKINSDPRAAADLALAMFDRNSKNTLSKEQLVYSWLYGLKGSWEKLKRSGHNGIKDNEYVKKVLSNIKKPQRQIAQQKQISKALVAGYGGASSPTSFSGGSVFQTEALDANKGLNYITCNDCGKEQVHAKYQVKCRHCGHSLSFEKLYNMLNNK